MDLLSPVPILEPMERIQCHGLSTTAALMESESNSSGGEIGEEERVEEEEKVYVAVGKHVKESKSVLLWALQHLEGRKICVLHVHQPAQMIPMMGGKFPANKLKDEEVKAYRDLEKIKMHNILNEYLQICSGVGVQAQKLHIDRNNIEEGIVYLIAQHGIKKLVMGAAADKDYNKYKSVQKNSLNLKSMTTLKSKKAVFVNQHANASCDILFVCNGFLICKREVSLDGTEIEGGESPSSISSSSPVQRGHLKSRSLPEGLSEHVKPSMLQALFRRISSHGGRVTTTSSLDEARDMSVLQEQLPSEGSVEGWNRISRWSPSDSSAPSTCSSSEEVIGSLESLSLVGDEGSEDGMGLHSVREIQENLCRSSPLLQEDGRVEDGMSNQLRHAWEEAKNSRREAFEESVRRRNAEKDAMEAKRKAKKSESLYADEVSRRRKMAEALARETLELNQIKSQHDKVVEELKAVLDQKSALEAQISDSNRSVEELEEKILSAVDLLISYKEERDQLLLERDNIVREVEELRKRIEEDVVGSQRPQFTPEFSFKEIEEATRSFDPSLMIGGGGYGSVYRGFLRNTEVAIKLLHSDSKQGRPEFQQEVDVLGRMRHPNLVTLIGACPEALSLIYEYLPNGSLEDRLNCKDNTPPLPWQRRICIAVEICSALIFLHSDKPDSVIHGDIKPANILLDANFVSKVGDFGICRLASKDSIDTSTACCVTNHPGGTPGYMDPEFLSTGELTPKSDVFSFGMILLRLLTGRQAFGLVKEVQSAIEKGNLSTLLDPTAGDWPFVQAKQLAHLALWCCEMSRKSRPELKSEVWRVLEPMKASCGASLSSRVDENRKVPSYFICPIFQEMMRDPHVAADGFTYEAEALKAWLDSGGHNTSPMTNLKLAHSNLIPNHSLRSAIEEWRQKH